MPLAHGRPCAVLGSKSHAMFVAGKKKKFWLRHLLAPDNSIARCPSQDRTTPHRERDAVLCGCFAPGKERVTGKTALGNAYKYRRNPCFRKNTCAVACLNPGLWPRANHATNNPCFASCGSWRARYGSGSSLGKAFLLVFRFSSRRSVLLRGAGPTCVEGAIGR